jgi:uridine kinase
VGANKQLDVRNAVDFSETVMALMESKVRTGKDSENKTFSELVKGHPLVINVGAERGSGKTTIVENHLVKRLEAEGIMTSVLHTDSYFKKRENHRCWGYNENPRNSDIPALLKDIRGFKAGETVAIRTGNYGASHKNISAFQTPVLIVEGMHALSILRAIKEADLVCALLLDPAARILRAMKRDSNKPGSIKKPQYYIELDMKSSRWWGWTGLLRMIDAHVVYKVGFDETDLRDLGRLAGWNTDELEERLSVFKTIETD